MQNCIIVDIVIIIIIIIIVRMLLSDVTIDELKELQAQITELKYKYNTHCIRDGVSVYTCTCIYFNFLYFSPFFLLPRTKDGNQLLVHSDDLDWNTIAYKQFNSEHSAYDCYLRYKNFLQPSVNHKEWTPNEVWKLNEIAKKHEQYDWEAIANELNTGRTAVQCLRCYKTSSHLLSKKYVTYY